MLHIGEEEIGSAIGRSKAWRAETRKVFGMYTVPRQEPNYFSRSSYIEPRPLLRDCEDGGASVRCPASARYSLHRRSHVVPLRPPGSWAAAGWAWSTKPRTHVSAGALR